MLPNDVAADQAERYEEFVDKEELKRAEFLNFLEETDQMRALKRKYNEEHGEGFGAWVDSATVEEIKKLLWN